MPLPQTMVLLSVSYSSYLNQKPPEQALPEQLRSRLSSLPPSFCRTALRRGHCQMLMNQGLTLRCLSFLHLSPRVCGGQRSTSRSHVSSASLTGSWQVSRQQGHFNSTEHWSAQVKDWAGRELGTRAVTSTWGLRSTPRMPRPRPASTTLHVT